MNVTASKEVMLVSKLLQIHRRLVLLNRDISARPPDVLLKMGCRMLVAGTAVNW